MGILRSKSGLTALAFVGLYALLYVACDWPAWVTLPVVVGLILLANQLSGLAFDRLTTEDDDSIPKKAALVVVWLVLGCLVIAMLGAVKDAAAPQAPLPWPAGTR